ncbi:hypothetical protein B7494_g8272 [Chlorociboria aeruginascens]|nr:hypothetical protein B7494_g8272 [Chlorociboria aeruginascens]
MAQDYELIPRSSSDSDHEFKDKPLPRRPAIFTRLLKKICFVCRPLYLFILFILFLAWQVLFNASYATPPPFKIPPHETVFIAANIIDKDLIAGAWGASVSALVNLIGKDRVHVSVYGGPRSALDILDASLQCNRTIQSEEVDPIDLTSIQHTRLPTGEMRIKRIAFLAEVRNKALQPLDTSLTKFDKVLFINDVVFDPEDAARLLWGTNVNEQGKAEYKAACGTDFISSWKYYDTFATRDFEGYSLGVPIFPWFSNQGDAVSRKDVLAEKDNVRVRSCWGGMVAFDARYFQLDPNSKPTSRSRRKASREQDPKLPLRFRSDLEPFIDSSECCLIHADILALPAFPTTSSPDNQPTRDEESWGTGIFMNPYVRVSYDTRTYSWIWVTKHFERIFIGPQRLINYFAKLPHVNPRRLEVEGQIIQDRLWVPNGKSANDILGKKATIGKPLGKEHWEGRGKYVDFERTAGVGGYCGVRQLLVLKEGKLKEGESNWDKLLDEVPPLE